MRIDVLTLFPKMFDALKESIIGRAVNSGLLKINVVDIREYSKDKHKKCDDTPFGGGSGMVMTPQPIYDAVNAVDPTHNALRLYLSPKGKRLTSVFAKELSQNYKHLLLLCGHYEGVDQRVLDMCFDGEVSIGDYVLTGGELPAMVLIDTLSRFIPNVLGNSESANEESFCNNLLEYPQYTRPYDFLNEKAPEVLLSGHHKKIEEWRKEQSQKITKTSRPDLIK